MATGSFWKERSLRTSDKKRTKAAELTLKESLFPICLVTILFFLWGFSYGLLDTLNKHFQNTLGITKARSSGLQAAYFGYVLPRDNSRAAWRCLADIPTNSQGQGLLYVRGAVTDMLPSVLIPLPHLATPLGSCVTTAIAPSSYGVSFCMALVRSSPSRRSCTRASPGSVFASSSSAMDWALSRQLPILTSLVSPTPAASQIASRPFLKFGRMLMLTMPIHIVCGPPRYAEVRINISQAFNGIGTVIAPVLGSYVFFNFGDEEALRNVQWVYLSIAVFVFILAFVFFMAHIPEITDADMAFQAEESQASADSSKPFIKQYRLFHAAFAQFCYTGAQVAIAR